jgi:hypothetical protein
LFAVKLASALGTKCTSRRTFWIRLFKFGADHWLEGFSIYQLLRRYCEMFWKGENERAEAPLTLIP